MKSRIQHAVAASAALLALAAPAGTVTFPAAPAELPASVQAKVALWLKGDANLVTDSSGNVVAWCDAREAAVADEAAYAARVAAGSWTYPRAVVYTAGECPSDPVPVGASAPTSFGGKPYVDFGEYQTDIRWMLFVDGTGARKRVPLTGYAGFIGFGSTAGFIVGDVNNPEYASYSSNYSGQNGNVYYHKGMGGSGDDVIFAGNNGNGRQGETRVNGRIVNPTATKHVRNGWEIFLQNGPNTSLYVSTLFNACNFKDAYPVSGNPPGDRQGGGKVAEIMLFSSMLTQDEAAEVEAYLRGRWHGGSGSAEDVVALAAADTLAANASSGPLFVGDVAGTGAIEKTGSETLVIDRNGRLAAGPLALREGKVETVGKRSHHAPLVAIGGKRVSAGGSSLAIYDDSGNPDRFTIVESQARRIPLAGAEAGVAKVAVSTARLLLQPPALPEAAIAAVESHEFMAQGNLIKNGSFEDTAAITHQNGAWQASVTPNEWSLSSLKNTGSGTWGVTTTSDTGTWLNGANTGEVADGTKAIFLQVNTLTATNGLRQSVSATKAGLYEFSAYIRCRYRNGYTDPTPNFVLLVDGAPMLVRRPWRIGYWDAAQSKFVTDGTATELKFKRVAVDVALSAGEHTIELLAVNSTNSTDESAGRRDRALLVDDVRLEPKAEGNFVAVTDGTFSSCNAWANTEINSNLGGSVNRNYTPFWTFSASSGYIVRYPTVWFWNPLYEGRGEDQAIVLQNGNTASQTVTLPKAGRVRVTCRYANRSDNLTGGARPNGQTVSVSLGDTVVASAIVTSQDMKVLVAEGEVSAGSQTLTLASSAVSGKDVATIIDDIRIEYVEDSPRIVSDTAFADNSASWTYSGAWAESDPYGLRELVFTNNASATLTFTAPSNGTYLLTFQTRGRPLAETGTDGVYHSYANYSHNLDVRLDGGFLANNYGEAATRHPVEIRLPYLTAGNHVLRFSGSCDAGVRETAQSRISDVTVTPLATGAMPDWSEMEFDLSSGAKIEADLGGTVKVKKLRVDGVSKIGEFTAANSDFVVGAGAVVVTPSAFVIVVR